MYPLSCSFRVPRNPGETNHEYLHRCWFIGKQYPKTMTELNQSIKWSLIEVNQQFHGCSYSEDIQDKIQRMRDKLFQN